MAEPTRIAQAGNLARLFITRARIELAVVRFRRELPAVNIYAAVWGAESDAG